MSIYDAFEWERRKFEVLTTKWEVLQAHASKLQAISEAFNSGAWRQAAVEQKANPGLFKRTSDAPLHLYKNMSVPLRVLLMKGLVVENPAWKKDQEAPRTIWLGDDQKLIYAIWAQVIRDFSPISFRSWCSQFADKRTGEPVKYSYLSKRGGDDTTPVSLREELRRALMGETGE